MRSHNIFFVPTVAEMGWNLMMCWHTEFGLDVLFTLGLHWIMRLDESQ